MELSIDQTFLPHTDPDAALTFYRDALGFEVRDDVGSGALRWITVAPPGATSIVLYPVDGDPDLAAAERDTIAAMLAKGSYARIHLATPDLAATFDRVQAAGADVVQEPTDQPWGVRDCAFRDPAGNLVRINQKG
ncbi:VOC family protein [Nocardia jiangsuensis]|uniref:VOC family protein n=1 Tax=Nocardia jiangsuensis TaxID=1691563 RepID=A0ABV8DU93_9NOCA